MTPGSLARILARLLLLAVGALSGAYLIVYLYRWEWNRALISGLFFLAAEVAYMGSSLRAEIRGLAARLDAVERPATPRRPGDGEATAARPAAPFAWLRDVASGQTNVFVPVLLGAGVILSAAAFVIERAVGMVARAGTRPTGAPDPVELGLPAAGLLGPVRDEPAAAERRAARRLRVVGGRVLAVAVLAMLVAAAVDLIADATQSRPSARVLDTSTTIELAIDQRQPRPASEAAEALAVACQTTLRADSEFTEIVTLPNGHVGLTVTPALSELRRRRLLGCLQDATIDLVRARVVGWTTTPPAAVGAGS
jgi:hypothetical protein